MRLIAEDTFTEGSLALYSVIILMWGMSVVYSSLYGAVMPKHGGKKQLKLNHRPTKLSRDHLALLCLKKSPQSPYSWAALN